MILVPETNSSSPFKSILLSFSSFFFHSVFFLFILSSDIFIIIIVDGSKPTNNTVSRETTTNTLYIPTYIQKKKKIRNGWVLLTMDLFKLIACHYSSIFFFAAGTLLCCVSLYVILNIIFAFINNQATKLHSL